MGRQGGALPGGGPLLSAGSGGHTAPSTARQAEQAEGGGSQGGGCVSRADGGGGGRGAWAAPGQHREPGVARPGHTLIVGDRLPKCLEQGSGWERKRKSEITWECDAGEGDRPQTHREPMARSTPGSPRCTAAPDRERGKAWLLSVTSQGLTSSCQGASVCRVRGCGRQDPVSSAEACAACSRSSRPPSRSTNRTARPSRPSAPPSARTGTPPGLQSPL